MNDEILTYLQLELRTAIDLRHKFQDHTALTGGVLQVVTMDGKAVRSDSYGNYHPTTLAGMTVCSQWEADATRLKVGANLLASHQLDTVPAQMYLGSVIEYINSLIKEIKDAQ